MKTIMRPGAALTVALSTVLTFAQSPTPTDTIGQVVDVRAPFVLKLRIDNGRYYEEHFNRIPYVAGDQVYLFAGENFGISVTIISSQISRITYERDPAKGDVEFKFTQEESPNGPMMMLMTRNRLKYKLFFDALMTVPGKKDIYKTRVLPVEPSLSNFESWPHPIIQLVLTNFRVSEHGPNVRR
jgi:hypothetical protein